MSFLAYLLLGLIAGAIAKAILPGKEGGGWIATLILGVIGAMVGGWLGGMLFNVEVDRFFSTLFRDLGGFGDLSGPITTGLSVPTGFPLLNLWEEETGGRI